jgi:hypothetical protein
MKTNKAIILAKIDQMEQELAAMATQQERDLSPQTLRLMDLRDENNIARRLKEVMAQLAENAGRGRAAGELEYEQAIATEPKSKWFFHLYGSGKGQSFHEQAGKSGYFKNPLTLGVRKQ